MLGSEFTHCWPIQTPPVVREQLADRERLKSEFAKQDEEEKKRREAEEAITKEEFEKKQIRLKEELAEKQKKRAEQKIKLEENLKKLREERKHRETIQANDQEALERAEKLRIDDERRQQELERLKQDREAFLKSTEKQRYERRQKMIQAEAVELGLKQNLASIKNDTKEYQQLLKEHRLKVQADMKMKEEEQRAYNKLMVEETLRKEKEDKYSVLWIEFANLGFGLSGGPPPPAFQ